MGVIDFHNHVMPAVDDGARTLDAARRALGAFEAAGVVGAVATPHFSASLTRVPAAFAARLAELDRGWQELQVLARETGFEVWRGAEVALDVPAPDLSDERLRLAGTRFVLVEFAYMNVPPNSPDLLAGICRDGWLPVLAHPERYRYPGRPEGLAAAWREAGARLQVNGASLLGRYGREPRQLAFALLAAGEADYLGSDYHARGQPSIAEYRAAIEALDGADQAALLLEVNPRRLLQDEPPLPVPPLGEAAGFWRRVKRLLRLP